MKSVRSGVTAACAMVMWATASAAEAQCPGRPTDPGGVVGFDYDGDTVAHYDAPGGRVRVHYAEGGSHAPDDTATPPNTAPDFVVLVGEVAEESLAAYADLGFREPVPDVSASCDSDGGDDRLDVYLVNFGSGDGQTVSGPCTVSGSSATCSAFVLVDHQLAGYASDTIAARTVVAHELFHVVQPAYVADLETWLSEGTAQWAADKLHPGLNDLESFLPAFFEEADRSLDNPPGGAAGAFLYGSAIWPVFLEQRFDSGVVADILESLSAGSDTWPAHDAALALRDSAMGAAFPEFAAWNGATGQRARTFGYDDAASYPEVTVEEIADSLPQTIEGITSGFSSRYFHIDVGPMRARVTIDANPGRNAGLVLPLMDGKAMDGSLLLMPATFQGEALIVVAGVSPLKPDGPFTVDIEVAPDEPEDTTTTTSAAGGAAAGGATTNGASASGSGGGAATEDTYRERDDGCSCSMPGARSARGPLKHGWGLASIALLALLAFVASRRTSLRSRGNKDE